jgi:Phosphotransferase enzyme family
MGSGGAVVRVGTTVRRPVGPHSAAVHAFLQHLEAIGFDGAPRYRGIDEQGRAVLSWIDGDVGLPPYPSWTASDTLLDSVAVLQRRLHEAARSFVPPQGAVWDRANLPPEGPGAIVCHNDWCVENVVVREGQAVAVIDFDFAAPTDPVIDIAISARHWVPVRDPLDVRDGRHGVDQVARFRRFCALHGLDRDGRRRVVAACGDFLDRALVSMRQRADAGQPLYVAAWEAGYEGQNRRSRGWLDTQAVALVRG